MKKWKSLSPAQLFGTPWSVAHQAPWSMEFFRQEYWNGFPCLLQGIFPTQGSNPVLPHCRQLFYLLSHQVSPMSHQGNANQNHNEIPLHSHQDGKETKVTQLCLTLCDPMEFSRPEYWSGQPFPSPGDLPHLGIKPRSPTLQADSLSAKPSGKPDIA